MTTKKKAEAPTKKELARLAQSEKVDAALKAKKELTKSQREDAAIKKGEQALKKASQPLSDVAEKRTKNTGRSVKHALAPVEEEPKEPVAVPVNPLTKALKRADFVFQRSQLVDARTSAHGFLRPDGAALIYSHDNTSTAINAHWRLSRQDGTNAEGRNTQDLAAVLQDERAPVVITDAALQAVRHLKEATKGHFNLGDLTGDDNYTLRLQLLKRLRGTDKVLVKETGINRLLQEFYTALQIPEGTIAGRAKAFSAQCEAVLVHHDKKMRAVVSAEKKATAETKRQIQKARPPILDGKTPNPAPKTKNKKQREAEAAVLKSELEAKAVDSDDDAARPNPMRTVAFDLSSVRALELKNGNVCLQLEATNSQGALSIIDNGTRVVACVINQRELAKARALAAPSSLSELAQRLLEPLNKKVKVRPAAMHHLKSFLAQMDLAALRADEAEKDGEEKPTIRPAAAYALELVAADLSYVHLLEDTNNGIVLLQLEKANSQGAICVYNDGRRVAVGVVPPEILKVLRPLASSDLVRDVNQLLHPITDGVTVTTVAERHLTAVLNACKENITMATEKTAKFAPPATAAKKTTKAAAAKPKKTSNLPKRAPAFAQEAVIKTLVKENPFRGTLAERFGKILDSKKGTFTVADYVKATDKYPDLGFFVKKGAISIK
jgi:hypothetical protein